ncbi:hypothetical protein TWF730_005417 [Orbilia blumenaviensis]|uniref:Early meiotic induction protein 1 n=1 Tax=Orbilia blumenaviensis TaxID=1796055 RepID=A0AAV9VJH6_9PEZI
MGFWTRQPAAAKDSTAPIEAAAAAAASSSSSSTQSSQDTNSIIKPKSRDDLADEELSALLKTLQTSSNDEDSDPSRKSSKPQNFQDTLYPTTMSCREAFDELYFCYSLGGQFKNLYRYGTYRRCEEKSDDFWFCMRTKMYGPNTKKEMIVKYHKEKEAEKYKKGPSSEDVWKVRTEPLEGQFMGTFGQVGEREAHEREI